jgi:hypothetical protein
MTIVDPTTQIIVGVIGYTRVIGRDGKIHFKGRKVPNGQASAKTKVLDVVTDALLG